MPRRIVHPDAAEGGRVLLEASDRHHLTRVLRLDRGAPLEVLDGRGAAFAAELVDPVRGEVEVRERLPPLRDVEPVTVVLAPLRSARVDWAVEKLSELGAERLLRGQAE